MPQPILIANWKMNLSLKELENLANDFKKELGGIQDKDIIICPSTVSLITMAGLIGDSYLQLGAQNVFWQDSGAYTGETSPMILKEIGCRYVIVGHSERRQYLNETDEMVNKKVQACLANNLMPILCIGETSETRQEGKTDNVLHRQLISGLDSVNLIDQEQLIIAYEPTWAIGSGLIADPEEVERVFALIRQTLVNLYPLTIVNNNVRIIYGGSVDASNIAGFSEIELLAGFLVGGASLEVGKFKEIVKFL